MKSSTLPVFLLSVFLLSVFFICCESQETQELAMNPIPDLTGTRWEHHYPYMGEGDVMIFYQEPVYPRGTEPNSIREKRGWYTNYAYETGHAESGTYEVKGDTLYLTEINFASDVPSIQEKEVIGYSKWVLSDKGLLYPVYRNFRSGFVWRELSPPNYLLEYMQVSKQ